MGTNTNQLIYQSTNHQKRQSRRDSNPNPRIRSPASFRLNDATGLLLPLVVRSIVCAGGSIRTNIYTVPNRVSLTIRRLLLFSWQEQVQSYNATAPANWSRERGRHRTCTTPVKSRVLCRLSYALEKRRKRIRARKNPELRGLAMAF